MENKQSLSLLANRIGILVEYHFFESYHGSSLCDAHAGHIKKSILKLIQNGTKITELDDLIDRLKALDLKNATFERMKRLVDTMLVKIKKAPGIKKHYKFGYDGKTDAWQSPENI